MKYSQWNDLSDEDKKNSHWKRHPRIRIATIFGIVFAVFFFVVMLRVLQNRRYMLTANQMQKKLLP
jgi:hypothetical protein